MMASAIMPTTDRRNLIGLALKCYAAQDWQEKELIVVDDGNDPIEDLLVNSCITNFFYYRVPKFKKLGDKINFCCEMANGEIIVTWDDDDWYAPSRITDQVTRLIESGKSLTGYHSMLFWDGQRCSQYRGAPNYAVGNTQVYKRDYWEKHKFPSIDCAYDDEMTKQANKDNEVVCVRGEGMAVARIHNSNVTKPYRHHVIGQGIWPYVDRDLYMPPAFFRDLA